MTQHNGESGRRQPDRDHADAPPLGDARNILGGLFALAVTFGIGDFVGTLSL